VVNLTNDKKSKGTDELEKLQKEIPHLEEIADKNYHHELLKIWGKIIGILTVSLFIGMALSLPLSNYISIPPITVERSKIEDIAKTIFTATVTISGLIIGFLPVVTFFFVRELKEEQQFIEREWTKKIEKYEGEKENNLNTINTYYGLHLMLYKNLRSGTLNYLKTYLIISLFLLFYLPMLYFNMILTDLATLFILINTIFSIIALTGIFPIVQFALTEPTYRIVAYVVPEKVIKRIEPK